MLCDDDRQAELSGQFAEHLAQRMPPVEAPTAMMS
jgi:hypothetical protein